ncbi:MAG: haloacid dehalogenase type II [Inquilinaceae bacterium]
MATLVFDVNETLLDLAALDGPFDRAFGATSARREWFALVLRTGLVATMIGDYRDFGAVGAAALDMLATQRGVDLGKGDRAAILGGMRRLPPHPDVVPALGRLAEAGHRLAALTNSTDVVAREQLDHAGLFDRFESILSADTVRRLKPSAPVYRMAAEALDVDPSDMWMIAAHDWDIAGAMRAGCHGIFVARPGMAPNPLFPPPDLVVADLEELAARGVG